MSETPKCEHCGSTRIQYWEKKKVWHSVIEVTRDKIRVGKELDEDVYDTGYMCTNCLEEQSGLSMYERQFLS